MFAYFLLIQCVLFLYTYLSLISLPLLKSFVICENGIDLWMIELAERC